MAIGQPASKLASDLQCFPTSTWGFVIYRTTYTPLSDREFPLVLQTINRHIRTALLAQRAEARQILGDRNSLASSLDVIWPRFRTTIMDNRNRFNVPLSYVRSDVESWLRSQKRQGDNSDHNICLAVDGEALKAFADARAGLPAEDRPGDVGIASTDMDGLGKWCLKAVEAWSELDEAWDDYDGIMKTQVRVLWELWQVTTDNYPVAYLQREANGTYDP